MSAYVPSEAEVEAAKAAWTAEPANSASGHADWLDRSLRAALVPAHAVVPTPREDIAGCVNYRAPQDCTKSLPNTDDWCGVCRSSTSTPREDLADERERAADLISALLDDENVADLPLFAVSEQIVGLFTELGWQPPTEDAPTPPTDMVPAAALRELVAKWTDYGWLDPTEEGAPTQSLLLALCALLPERTDAQVMEAFGEMG
jgi:hypothetical protein